MPQVNFLKLNRRGIRFYGTLQSEKEIIDRLAIGGALPMIKTNITIGRRFYPKIYNMKNGDYFFQISKNGYNYALTL